MLGFQSFQIEYQGHMLDLVIFAKHDTLRCPGLNHAAHMKFLTLLHSEYAICPRSKGVSVRFRERQISEHEMVQIMVLRNPLGELVRRAYVTRHFRAPVWFYSGRKAPEHSGFECTLLGERKAQPHARPLGSEIETPRLTQWPYHGGPPLGGDGVPSPTRERRWAPG
ncbi:hypothetical protein NQD34_018210 [Periophthalmus magnuspinnatus]|nr:hypothetical protein NQD34_018210 [Periophthalmus magnuspinnatus]